MKTTKRGLCLLAVLAGVACCGCSGNDRPRLGRVSGIVTLDDRPLAGAAVVFTPIAGGRQSMALADADGRFELLYIRDIKGAKLGRHRVRVTTATEDSPGETLPARYNRETILSAEVTPGANTVALRLESD